MVFNEVETMFKKTDDILQNEKISEKEQDQEEFHVEMKHRDVKVKNQDVVAEEAHDVEANEKIEDDYLLARDRPRRVVKPPHRFGYANFIAYALTTTSEILDEEPRYYMEELDLPLFIKDMRTNL